MRQRGFSLIELVVAIAIISILLSMATMSFNYYNRKSRIEDQIKSVYSDIVKHRTEAMFKRTAESIKYTTTTFAFYSSSVVTVQPVYQRILKYPMNSSGSGQIDFDERGLSTPGSNASICVSASNEAAYDSIVVGTVRTQMGKSNGTCTDANIQPK